VTLVEGGPSDADSQAIARITARYSDGRGEPPVALVYEARGKQEKCVGWSQRLCGNLLSS
jgi:hypothetical protein